ncbi:hypothetical protein [Paraburkholderia silvatlantica]|nr:hypothetical protein [Paraburkholderia silvatlantica]
MPANQARAWLHAANWLGIRDPDDLYIPIILLADLIVATLVYSMIMKLWRHFRS